MKMNLVLRQSICSLYAACRYTRILLSALERQATIFSKTPVTVQWMASGTHDVLKDLSISDVIREGKNGVLIIDVREQNEVSSTGLIPGSINIPLGVLVEATKLAPDEFKQRYSVKKPEKNDKIIISCSSGIRSRRAVIALQDTGFHNVFNNAGGWKAYEELIKG